MTQPGVRMERDNNVIGQRPGEDLNGATNAIHLLQEHARQNSGSQAVRKAGAERTKNTQAAARL